MRPYESSSQHNTGLGGYGDEEYQTSGGSRAPRAQYPWSNEEDSPGHYRTYQSTPPQASTDHTAKTYTSNRSGSNRSSQATRNPRIFQRRVSTRKPERRGQNPARGSSHASSENRQRAQGATMSGGVAHFPQTCHTGTFKGEPTVEVFAQTLPNFPSPNYAECLTRNLGTTVDVPLCVQEAGEGEQAQGSRLMPFHAPPNDQYYMQHYYPMMETQAMSLNISPEKILNALRLFIRLVYKTLKAVIIKIRRELDTREVIVDPSYRIPSLPNMDVGCNVCEKTDGDRALLGLKDENEFSYFEEPDTTPKFISSLWKQLNDWMDMDEKAPVTIARGVRPTEPDVFYKVGPFPKDEQGKVELPTFEKVPKRR